MPQFIEKNNWRANSCVLNPLDYAVWGLMEQSVYGSRKRYDTVEEVKAALNTAWKRLPQQVINDSINQWSKRLQLCIDQVGGHIEQFL